MDTYGGRNHNFMSMKKQAWKKQKLNWLRLNCPSNGIKKCIYIVYMYWNLTKAKVISGSAVILVTTPLGSSKEQMMILKLF